MADRGGDEAGAEGTGDADRAVDPDTDADRAVDADVDGEEIAATEGDDTDADDDDADDDDAGGAVETADADAEAGAVADDDADGDGEADADDDADADVDADADDDVDADDDDDVDADAEAGAVAGADRGGEVVGSDWSVSGGSLVGVGAGRRVLVVRVVLVGVLFVMVAAFAAAGWSQSRAEVYEATAEIRYRAVDDVAFGAADRALASQLAAITTQAVIVPAAAALSVDADELAERVSAALVPDSDVIRVRATAPSPGEAERVLGAVVDQYLERVASEETSVEGAEFLSSELDAVDEELAALESALGAEDRVLDSAETAQLAARYESLLGYRTTLAERLAELNIELLSERRTDVLASPKADLSPVSPQPARAALVAAMAAGLVALAAATVVLRRPTHPTPVEAT